jgi:hypothetical protein
MILPLFGAHEGAVDEALGEVQPAVPFQVFRQCSKNLIQDTFLVPPLEAPVTRLVRRVAFWQVALGSAGT